MGKDTEILILYGRRFLSRKLLDRKGLTGIYRNTARNFAFLPGAVVIGLDGYGDVSEGSHGSALQRPREFNLLVVCAKGGKLSAKQGAGVRHQGSGVRDQGTGGRRDIGHWIGPGFLWREAHFGSIWVRPVAIENCISNVLTAAP